MSDSPAKESRRRFLAATGSAALGAAGVGLSTPSPAQAATKVPASAQKKCATCRYWGGVRRVSRDGGTVSAEGKGWCNNPKSPAYQKQTRPTQGAPVWTRWDALV